MNIHVASFFDQAAHPPCRFVNLSGNPQFLLREADSLSFGKFKKALYRFNNRFYIVGVITLKNYLSRYIIRASFSQERMQYLAEPSKVAYRAKDGSEEKVFDALVWLPAMPCHC